MMKRSLFRAALVAAGVATLGGFENGDGLPPVEAQAWTARNDALSRARIFRDEEFDASAIDFAADPNRGAVDPAVTTCRYTPDEASGTTPKFDCVLPGGGTIEGQVRLDERDSIGNRRNALASCVGIRCRPRVACRDRSLSWLSVSALSYPVAGRVDWSGAFSRQPHRLHALSRVQERECRAESRRRRDRGR